MPVLSLTMRPSEIFVFKLPDAALAVLPYSIISKHGALTPLLEKANCVPRRGSGAMHSSSPGSGGRARASRALEEAA